MPAALVCPACHDVVLPDAIVISNWHFGYTWLGDRKKWTHADFGVVHLCDPIRRSYVLARDPRAVANPPWVRVLWRHRWSSWLARRLLPVPDFLPLFRIDPPETR